MAEYIEVRIESNAQNLSGRAVHESLFHLVKDTAEEGADFLKIAVPHGDTFSLSTHAGHKGPKDDGINMHAEVGIPPIDKKNFWGNSDPNSMRYPEFVDQGTGIFGAFHTSIFSKRSEFMKLPPKEPFSIFHKEVKGQEGQHFMAKTYAFMKELYHLNAEQFKQELTAKLKPDT